MVDSEDGFKIGSGDGPMVGSGEVGTRERSGSSDESSVDDMEGS